MVFLLYSGTIQLWMERDLKLSRLSIVVSLYLPKFMKHNKSNATFVHEVIIIFSPVYLSEATYAISSFNIRTEL